MAVLYRGWRFVVPGFDEPDPATGLLPDGSTPPAAGTILEQAPSAGTVKDKGGLIKLFVAAATC